MNLCDILNKPYTDASYLAAQRERHQVRCEKVKAEIHKKKNDAEYVERMRSDAAYTMKDLFILPGSNGEYIHIGTPPAWQECRTGDVEYLCGLNRMAWFCSLSELFVLTGERAYADKVVADLCDWIDQCPVYPLPSDTADRSEINRLKEPFIAVTPWHTLDVGIRMFISWNFVYKRLLATELMTPALHTKLTVSFYEHAKVLSVISPVLFPNADHNHYLHEMLSLLNTACLFPDMKEADQWRSSAVKELERCAKNQFSDDGGQVEGSPHYHELSLSMLFRAVEIMNDFSITLPDGLLEVCKKATEYVLYTVWPNGHLVSVGDSPIQAGGTYTTVEYYKCFGELGPTAKIFGIHPNIDPLEIPEKLQCEARKNAGCVPGGDNYQRQLGQYIARTGWTREDSYFLFICCTPVYNTHAHQDPMSFVLTLKGDPVVIDPSYYAYRDCPERKLFKSPEYHSCLTFDNKPPFEYIDSWNYGPQKEGSIWKTYHSEGIYAADASHHNYDPDYHKRLCALIGDDIFIVADDVVNITGTDVRLYFHMDDPSMAIENGAAVSSHIRVLLPKGLDAQIIPSEKSPFTDLKEPSSRIMLTDRAHTNATYLTVFTKREDVAEPQIRRTKEGIRISYQEDGNEKAFLWRFSESFERCSDTSSE